MERKIQRTIDVNAPVAMVYGRWSDFEHFPSFMRGVVAVEEIDETHQHWLANVGGVTEEWDTEITENVRNERIAWHSTSGAKNAGLVSFQPISEQTTRVMLEVDYEPSGVVEEVGDLLGFVRRRIDGDLAAFKTSIER